MKESLSKIDFIEAQKGPNNIPGSKWYEIWTIFVLSLSSLTIGATFTWTSPSIPRITTEEFGNKITLEEASYLTVLPSVGILCFAPLAAWAMNHFGRKTTMLFICIPHLTQWIIIATSQNIYLLYISRFINGCGDSIMFTVLPNYVAEIASPDVRGSWGNVPTVAIFIGQFLINAIGGYCTVSTTAIIFCVFPILYAILFWPSPETPYYLIMKNKQDEARLSLQKLRQTENVEEELNKLIDDVNRQLSEESTWKELLTNPVHRRALLAGGIIRVIQQFSGISSFSTYTVYLFEQAGVEISHTISAMIFALLLVIMNIITSYTLDKLGRKLAMIISTGACSIILLSEFLFFYLKDELKFNTTSISWFPLLGMALYVVFFAIGLGIVPTLIVGELFSASIKAKGVCALNLNFAILIIASTKIFQLLTANYGLYVPFILFFCCTFIGSFVSYFIVPETKGKTLEEIQQSMKK